MSSVSSEWIGSVYLYIHSESTSLTSQYDASRPAVYAALRNALSEVSGGSANAPEILKINQGERDLILHLKFYGRETCQRFIQDYRKHRVRQHLENHLRRCDTLETLQVSLQLKDNQGELNTLAEKEEQCLQNIASFKPSYQKDDTIAELDRMLMTLSLGSVPSQNDVSPANESSPSLPSQPQTLRSCSSEGQTFQFQGQEYADRPLTPAHHQLFAKKVGKVWKKVGRSLRCRALEEHDIENLAYQYDRDGLYEQAYQMLRRFTDCEGRKASLQRLVEALVENDLNTLAEDLLSLPAN